MTPLKIFQFLCLVFGFVDLTRAADCTTCTAMPAGNCVTNQEMCGGAPFYYEDPQITYSTSGGCRTVTLTCQGYDNLYIDGVTPAFPDGSDGGVLINAADSADPSTLLVVSSTLACDATGTWTLGGQPVGNEFDCQVWTPVSTTTTTTTPTTTPTPPTCTTCTALPAGDCVANQNGCNGAPFNYRDPLISYSTNSAGCRVATLTCLGYNTVHMDGVTLSAPDGSDGGVLLDEKDDINPTSLIVVTGQVTCDSNGVWNFNGQPVGNNFDCQVSTPIACT
ncbi:unnamed protein product, partial [Mesorhabditis belari]|uniref:C6 domain-containing protein n=1 Tax=Mesorhabditis belari TaxID=2138241 RepID=A0AAF3EIH9_9BILA